MDDHDVGMFGAAIAFLIFLVAFLGVLSKEAIDNKDDGGKVRIEKTS